MIEINFKKFRMMEWLIISIIAVIILAFLAPNQSVLTLYKINLCTISAVLAYWIDRSLFKRAEDRIIETSPRDIYSSARLISRSIIFLGCILGVSQGL